MAPVSLHPPPPDSDVPDGHAFWVELLRECKVLHKSGKCSATKLDPRQNPARLCWALGYGAVYFRMGGDLRRVKRLPR